MVCTPLDRTRFDWTVSWLRKHLRELERLLGRKTMEVEILRKEALDVAGVKKPSLGAAIMERSQGRFAMKAVADTLAVVRTRSSG